MSGAGKTIGVLTSGGDAPGLNAAIRAVVRTALYKGMRVIGVKHGYSGLINGDLEEMSMRSVSDILHHGGTVLYTARSKEFRFAHGVDRAAQTCREAGIEGLVTIGGDGTFRGAKDLCDRGIACIGIPGTIDNDIACSEYTIGFNTALSTAMEAVDRLRDTSQSHNRCSLVEVMGNGAGHLALQTGLACGALATMVPELNFDLERDIIEKMRHTRDDGKRHFIIIVSEGIADVHVMAQVIQLKTGIETRATILGHIQRGGSPTPTDRIIATRMGSYAVELLERGAAKRVVALQNNNIVDFDIDEALTMKKEIDMDYLRIINTINI